MTLNKILASLFVTALSFAWAPSASAQYRGHDHGNFRSSSVSLGVGFGDPTALDLKLWTGDFSGFDFGVGLQRFSERLGVYAEYELGLVDFWFGHSVRGVFYLGIGGAVAFRHQNEDTSLALVIPIGFNLRFEAPIEIYLEGRPGVEMLDSVGFGLGGQVGIRYVF